MLEDKLREIQRRIAKKIILEDKLPKLISTIAGFDLAFLGHYAYIAGVVLDYNTLNVLEVRMIKSKISFPYISTFLTFREGLPIIEVYKKLKTKPDILMINGHGIAHPLFCGIASHIGVLLDMPSIGVAQSKLCGEFREPKKIGEFSTITYQNKKVGYVYKSQENCRPIFVSPGHKISLETSLKIVKSTIRNHKLPEPLHIAHELANKK